MTTSDPERAVIGTAKAETQEQEIIRLRAENAELKRQLERAEIWAKAFTVSAINMRDNFVYENSGSQVPEDKPPTSLKSDIR